MSRNNNAKLIAFYNRLLEAERAGVQSLTDISSKTEEKELKPLLMRFLQDEGMNCQILRTLIINAHGGPSPKTGDFIDKIRALSTVEEQLLLLIKGQEWVAKFIRKNRELLSKVSDKMFMESIKIQHEENVDALLKYVNTDKETKKISSSAPIDLENLS
jgi:hypothetical protein